MFAIDCTVHTRPEGHGSHCDTSVLPLYGDHVPCGHARHDTESSRDRNVPAGQIDAVYVPKLGHSWPAGQTRHVTVDFSGAYVPAKHSVGVICPFEGTKLPRGACVGHDDPGGQ